MTFFCLNFKCLKLIPAALLAPMMLLGCDDGHIDDPVHVDSSKYFTVHFVATVTGLDDWDDFLMPVLAGYDGESQYSLIQKNITLTSTDDEQPDTLTLSRIPLTVTSVEVAVANVLRQRQASIFAYAIPDGHDPDVPIVVNVGSLDVSRFGAVNAAVFQGLSCFRCHQGDEPPAGLSLVADVARDNLVGVPSAKSPSQTLAVPGRADDSFLVKVITDGDDNVHYDHRPFFAGDDGARLRDIIKAWVNNIDE